MTTGSAFTICLQWLGLIAVEAALAVTLAALAQRFLVSARSRRSLWQVCLLSLLLLPLLECSGAARRLADWVTRPAGRRAVPARDSTSPEAGPGEAPLPALSGAFRREVAGRLAGGAAAPGTRAVPDAGTSSPAAPVPGFPRSGPGLPGAAPADAASDAMAVLLLGLVWVAGSGVVLGRILFGGLILVLVRLRRRAPADATLQARVGVIARTLGLGRRIRLMECPGLAGPMVFGAVLPALGVPAGFARRFRSEQQDAILAHEVAHLAARDPFWYLLANLMTAVWWWHPLAWWARRQLHVASEQAADEASLLVPDGPAVLAECLVELGARLGSSSSFFRLGIQGGGARSGLGRRVERLLKLSESVWTPVNRFPSALARVFGPSAVAVAAILSTAWVSPRAFNQGESMKTIQQTWQRSLMTLGLLSSLQGDARAAVTAAATGGVRPDVVAALGQTAPGEASAVPANAAATPAGALPAGQNTRSPKPAQATQSAQPAPDNLTNPLYGSEEHQEWQRRMLERYGIIPTRTSPGAGTAQTNERNTILARLEQLTLSEAMFDGVPLPEALRYLSDESRKRDPDKRAINFLINPNAAVSVAGPTIDPSTGQPVPSPAPEPLDMNSVTVRFNLPLRDVRLKDVLDAIVKVADRPIEYSVEDYGVVFSAAAGPSRGVLPAEAGRTAEPGSMALQVRTFKVDSEKLWPGIQRAFGVHLSSSPRGQPVPATEAARARIAGLYKEIAALESSVEKLSAQFTPESPYVGHVREQIANLKTTLRGEELAGAVDVDDVQRSLRQLLTQLGINMEVPGKAIYYNDMTGIVMVRATADDLEVVKAAIETLGGYTAPDQSSSRVPASGMNEEMMRRYGLLPAKP